MRLTILQEMMGMAKEYYERIADRIGCLKP